jgi:signal transduction histidine kinase
VALSILAAVLFSRRQRMNEEAQRLLAAREEENRHWQAIGQMAATVAHEVRTPLSSLKMIGQRLRREFTVPEADRAEFDELLALLDSESERVNRVVSEFLELGRPLVLSRKQVGLQALLDECIAPLRIRADREGKVLDTGRAPAEVVSVDSARFHQVIRNIAGNALDAVRAGGRVGIVAEKVRGGFAVRITDNGPGMDADTLVRAQQPFMTTKASGTGLGLPLARRLVEAHGGRLEMKSQAGVGTEVSLFFPDGDPDMAEKGINR